LRKAPYKDTLSLPLTQVLFLKLRELQNAFQNPNNFVSETLQPCKVFNIARPPIHSPSAQCTEGKHEYGKNKNFLS
jgi:hypothetical protein